ncbi:MAG: GNAT family N-acetyltransferase [Anaerolineaceae bacterium]|nr:GNAT family N-acetyltransferase [Anaerolineaceae bacterium]
MDPSFPVSLTRSVRNFLTGKQYTLHPLNASFCKGPLELKETHYAQIVRICNQPGVYSMLFARRLNGLAYGMEDARRFVRSAEEGWQNGTHFVFITRTEDGSVTAALDIKSADLTAAEIGYWASAEHPGLMTNALLELVHIARQAGYRCLYAIVREDNPRSTNVLTRAGFACSGHMEKGGLPYLTYELTLTESTSLPF